MVYRLYRDEDFAQLYAIEQECFKPPLRFSRAYMRALVGTSDAATWIAEESGQLAGFAIIVWTPDSDGTVAYIQTLEVAPAQRRKGIGQRLLQKLEASARNANAAVLWLHVDVLNAGAIRLYEEHGYQHQGREDNYYAPGMHALTYAKPLAKPPSKSAD